MNVRRSAAALAASAVLCAGAAPAALATTAPPAPSAPPVVPAGLYGTADPSYDGVWRQSFALLAQDTVGVVPAAQAVDWLVGQQCANGAFSSFRADTAKPCDATTMLDSNATAMAVQALTALGGREATVTKAVDWLKSVQNEDGGWSYVPGSPSESSSTSLVLSTLGVAGASPADVTSGTGRSGYDALLPFQLGCDAEPAADRGAFAYEVKDGKRFANADATAAATLAVLGKGAVVAPAAADTPAPAPECPAGAKDLAGAARGSAGHLAEALKKDGHFTVATPGSDQVAPDYANTADAVIALAAGGHRQAAEGALQWLKAHSAEWAEGSPAALGTLVLAAHATGTDPKSFGSTDLVAALNATGPAPQAAGTGTKDSAAKPAEQQDKDKDGDKGGDSGNGTVWWIIGAGAAAGTGIGILLSGRRKKNQL
ncbi:prenyltransferase/squalene oxidase repeat-containing protein [Streptomyces sp. NPDC051567]|uniref:prenyltransferase/squalene oxidase repeat-containing protein n=1 Tax=Streptomyces sp. NPDC051567 TaxID=3365660 RepID=UPI0037A264CA